MTESTRPLPYRRYVSKYHGTGLNFGKGKKIDVYFSLYNANNGVQKDGVGETTLTVSSTGSWSSPWHYLTDQYGDLLSHWTAVQVRAYYPYPIDEVYYAPWAYCSGQPAATSG